MAKSKRKLVKTSLIILALLVVGGFFVNWYLTYRLESKLNKKLSEEIYKATDGFYRFSFEGLSIGLFSGELSIRGIEFYPDSVTFDQWEKGDSLPDVYYKIRVGEIHFKGVNLAWRLNYTTLNFSLFEINSPDIKVFDPSTTVDTTNVNDKELNTLYQVISPYIDLVTVNKINLTNANASYTVTDTISPVIYSLQEANFHAYNFRLDKDSYMSGKLLYCDNFEFSASKPQSLLFSDQIILNTNNIQLSTIDSIIKIEGVNIHPKDELWEDRMEKAGAYLKARIDTVTVKGVDFKRERGLNFVHARSFDITSTDIQYYSVIDMEKKDSTTAKSTDDITPNWSLYTILSPILHRISIDKIGIEKTRFNYTHTQDEIIDVYTLGQFDFHANNFLIDSLSEKHKKFWYVDNFTMISDDINGLQRSNNADISIKRMYLNTDSQKFEISDIEINPLSTNTKKDYLSGRIKSISVEGLDYNTGVSAEQIKIDSSNIEYFKLSSKKQGATKNKDLASTEDALDFFTPYSDFLSVKSIDLANISLVLHDKRVGETFRINNFKFYASQFLINEETRTTSPYFFTFEDIGFSLRNFDNILPGKNYRLQVKKADISTRTGIMRLENVKLTPQEKTWKQAPAMYYEINAPLISATGFDNNDYIKNKILTIKDFQIVSPLIRMIKTRDSQEKNNSKSKSSDISSLLTSLTTNTISINNAKVIYLDKITKDSLYTSLSDLKLKSLKWNIQNSFSIGEFILQSPDVYYTSHSQQNQQGEKQEGKVDLKFLGRNINIGKFIVSDISVDLKQSTDTFDFRMKQFDFSGFRWNIQDKASSLDLATINLSEPTLKMNKNQSSTDVNDTVSKSTSQKDFYSSVEPYFNRLSIKEFNLTDANFNYSHVLNEGKQQQTINKTNLMLRDFWLDTNKRKYDLSDIKFNSKYLLFPIMDGFYTLGIGNIDIDKNRQIAELSDIKMKSTYPKFEFAYKHPKHKDWFDVTVGDIKLTGLDFPTYFSDNTLKAKNLFVSDVYLQNLKNQQIEIQHNIMPLIYEKIQQLPIGLDIDTADVRNFSVLYEELPKNGTITGKIRFDNMNGKLSGLTNIVSYPNQFIRLDADGKFMNGYFTARWDIPVSPDYDCFMLSAKINGFDLKNLNDIFVPLAKAEVQSGMLNNFLFSTEASSTGATANMLFLYNNLKVSVLKDAETEQQNKFLSRLANIVVRSNNPNKPDSKPRVADVTIERDPYHSTFNYFWQILQPAVVESAGVSQGKQNFAKKVGGFFTKIKNFFTGGKKDENKEDKEHLHE